MESDNNGINNNGNHDNNGHHRRVNDDNINIIEINNNPDIYYNNGLRRSDNNHEEVNNDSVIIPLALRSEMLRMLYELRIPLYGYGGVGAGRGGAMAIDEMEHAAAAVLARSLYDSRPVKHVIDIPDDESGEKHGIRTLAYHAEISEEMKINTACGIWQEEFEEGEEISILPCNHAFKAEAITKWLTTEKAECPICRFKLASKEVIIHSDGYEGSDGEGDSEGEGVNGDENAHQAQPRPQPQPEINEQRARENNIMNRQNNRIHNPAHAGGAADMGRDAYYGISMPMNRLLQMRASLINGARAGGGGARLAHAHADLNSQQQPSPHIIHPPQVITNINNNYYINQYHISAEEQEQADIEEAIRRSLQ
jgi:hypothetical protein